MRSVWLLGLAACWSPKPPPAPRSAPSAPAPAATPPAARTYVLPDAVADALAAEKLSGNVLVPADAPLYASVTAARKDRTDSRGRAIAMRVVADRGDVVEVSTGAANDCVVGWTEPYDLHVFVPRVKLIPRAKAGVVKTFSDGTAIAIDRGAPVELSDKGLAWASSAFAAVSPAADQLVLAVPPGAPASALPAAPGERLLCEHDRVVTRPELADSRRRQREAREEERAERRQRLLEARRRETPPVTKPAPKKKVKDIVQPVKIEKEPYISDRELGLDDDWDDRDRWYDERAQPWCGIGEPYRDGVAKPPPPAIDGHALAWPYADDVIVTRAGSKYFADVEETCGRVRMAVAREGVMEPGVGGAVGGMLGGQKVQVWVPSPGNVTWRDGSPAGTYAGGKKYREVVEEATRICVYVDPIAEVVCHDKSTAKTEMVSAWGY